jgi:hypothetical protein
MLDSNIKARQRLAEVETMESETMNHSEGRSSRLIGDESTRLRLRAWLNQNRERLYGPRCGPVASDQVEIR